MDKKKKKVGIGLLLLALVGFAVWWFRFRNTTLTDLAGNTFLLARSEGFVAYGTSNGGYPVYVNGNQLGHLMNLKIVSRNGVPGYVGGTNKAGGNFVFDGTWVQE